MKYYVLNTSKCWADEFDVPILELITEEELREYQKAIDALKDKPVENMGIGFGTNEYLEFDYEELQGLLAQVREITEEEYNATARVFGLAPGIMCINDILERLNEYLEEDEE